MEIDWILVSRYAAPLLALFVGAALNRLMENRPKLVTFLANAAAVQVRTPQQSTLQVHTHSIVVRNNGRKAATNLRLGHNALPDFSVYPAREYRVVDVDGGRELVFPVLPPRDQFTVAYLYFPPMLWSDINTYTRADEGSARILQALPTPQPPQWLVRLSLFLLVIGAFTTLFVVGQFLTKLVPLVYAG